MQHVRNICFVVLWFVLIVIPLKKTGRKFDNIVFTGGTVTCHYDHLPPVKTELSNWLFLFSLFTTCRWFAWWLHQMETFSALLALCAGNSPVPGQWRGQWRGALMFYLICARINGWVNNCEAGDLRRRRAHCGVILMVYACPLRWLHWYWDNMIAPLPTKLPWRMWNL